MAEKYLHAVSCRGDLDAVKHCLEHAHPAVDGARTRGRTALWEAAARGHAAVCAALLDAGASADAEDWSGSGPLVVAARRGRHRAVAAFVARGHAPATALEAAALKGHDDVVQQLLRAGALPTPTALADGDPACFPMLCDNAPEEALYDAMARPDCRKAVATRIAAHLDEGIERRMFEGEDLRKVEREKEEESKRLEGSDDPEEDYWSDVIDSKPCLRRGVAALLRRDVHDELKDEATRWIVLSRVAALCAGKNMEPFALHACTRSFVDGRRTLAFTGFNDGGDPLQLRQDVEALLKNVAETADATESAVRAVCGLRNREKRLSYAPAPRAALLLRACVARFRGKDEDSVAAGGVLTFESHEDFCDATLALCDWCWALKPEAHPPPPPLVTPEPQRDWCPAGAPMRRVHDRRLAVTFSGGGPARVSRRRRRPIQQQQRRRQSLPKELGRGELLDFYDGGYGLVVVKIALDEEGCTCEFRLKGPVASSTGVGERLLEPVLALPEAPVNFEDLSFVDHPPTAATLLLLADEPVSEDEDF